jgi:hypothetical protein
MAALPNVTIRSRAVVESYEQSNDGVVVHCRDLAADRPFDVGGGFLVGCDGGRSTVRKQMGARLLGDAELGRTRTTLVRCPQIRSLFGDRRPAWMSWIANHKVRGNVVAIDGDELWLLHRGVPARGATFEDVDFHQSILDLLGVDDLDYQIVTHEDWTGRRLVADRFRDGNVFIAGDAAHLWVPFAGYGMNAGIADGVELAWLLSAVINGWADPGILDAYEAERRPITDQVSRHAMAKVLENADATGRGAIPPALSQDTEEGAELRRVLGKVLYDVNVAQFAPEGLNFGYFYDRSPIIAYDGETAPDYTMGTVTASTVPGCRMPHFVSDGTPILDLLGPDYTLIRFDPGTEIVDLVAAASAARVPVAVLDLDRPAGAAAFARDLMVVRFDQHVAWRGDRQPDDCAALIATLRGAVRPARV